MKKKLALLLSLALCVTLLAGCSGSSGSSDTSDTSSADAETASADAADSADTTDTSAAETDGELTSMTIAFCTWAGYAPLFIADEMGYFEAYGYDVDIIIMEDESTYGAAFVSNSIQALGQVLDRDIIQYAAGAPEQYVCTMDASTGGDGLVADESIETVEDLAGKTIALDKSATSYFFFLQVLEDYDVTEDDMTIVEMGNDEAGQAFIAGQVDAAITWEPILSSCEEEREGGHILVTSADYPKAILDVLTVNSNFAEEHPDIYEVLAECWYQAVDYLNENFEEGCEIMAVGLDLDTEEVMEECEGITYYDREANEEFNDLSTEENVKDIAEMAAGFWVEKGLMDTDDLDGFFPTLE